MPTATGERTAVEAALALTPTALQSNDTESDVPTVESPQQTRMAPRIRKCRELDIGVEAIRAGGTFYLPQYPNESASMYEARRTIAALFNGFKRWKAACVGLLLQSEPTFTDDMPQQLVDIAENIDLQGSHLTVFTRKLLDAGMTDGFAGIFTDYPRADDPRIDRSKASLAAWVALDTGAEIDGDDEAKMGLRPYFVLVKVDDVRPFYETVNGRRVLVMLIIRENGTEKKGRFGIRSVIRYRVYTQLRDAVMCERWTTIDGETKQNQRPIAMRNVKRIPWSPFVAGTEIAPDEYVPPGMDMAELNLTHHRIQTGILSLQELAFIPTMVRIGAQPSTPGVYPPVVLGPGNTIEVPATEGVSEPIYWLSPDIDVLEPAAKSLETCKAEMGAMGAAFLAPEPRAQETAEAHRIDSTHEKASIVTVGRAAQDCLESAFAFAGDFKRVKAGSVRINRDFEKMSMDERMMSAWVALVESGFDEEEATQAFKVANLLSENADVKKLAQTWRDNRAAKQAADEMAQAEKMAAENPAPRPRKTRKKVA